MMLQEHQNRIMMNQNSYVEHSKL